MTYFEMLKHLSDESAYAVDSSEWSRREWMRVRESAPDLDALQKQGEIDYPNFSDLQCDAYHSFYLGKPDVKGADELSDKGVASRHIANHMQSLEDYKKLRAYTQHNQPASTVAVRKVNSIVDALPQELKEKISEQQGLANELEEQEEELESLRDMWRDLDEQDEEEQDEAENEEDADEPDGDEEEKEEGDEGEEGEEGDALGPDGFPGKDQLVQRGKELAEQVDRLSSQVSKATQELNAAFGESEDDVRAAVRGAAAEGVEEIEDLNDALSAFGCGSGAGINDSISLEEQMKVARMLRDDDQLRWIAEMAGRIERIIKRTKQEKVASMGGGSIVDIELTGDVARLVPSELMRFGNKTMKRELMMRLAERKALGWKKERRDKVGKGPIICCVDNSGSMDDNGSWNYSGGQRQTWDGKEIFKPKNTPIIWAKAVALSLYRECHDRGVPFIYVHFSSGGRVDVRRFDAKPGEEIDFMQFSKIFHSGGTDYRLALNACLEQFEEDGMEKADVVFISDGEYPSDTEMGREYREKMDELGGKTLGIQIGGRTSEKPFGDFADGSWMLDIAKLKDTPGSDAPILREMFTDFL